MNGARFWLGLAVGGALGTVARYALGGWVQTASRGTFPWGTCVVNLLGCLAIGALAGYTDRGGLLSPELRVALLIGVLGGFTTFSSFGLETFNLLADGDLARAAAYVGLTNGVGLFAVWLGYRVLGRL